MRSIVGSFLAVSLFTAPVAFASPASKAQAQSAKSASGYQVRRGPDNKNWLDRTLLPKTGAARIAVLKQAMEHEITGHANFSGADTPAFEIVSHGAPLQEQLHANTVSLASAHQTPVMTVKASDLVGGKLKTTFLLPVSGHVGLSEAQRYAKTNVFEIMVNGKLTKVPAQGFVTAKEMELTLKPGRNTITAEPYTGALGGYAEGRTIIIDVQ